jgi:succinate dehydrogenase flavin-adding protein (antitoxin of CptAB toxin-antitoxin module)
MKKHFYSNLVDTDSIVFELETLNLSKEEKDHLTMLVHSNMHHTVIEIVLSELPEEEKKIFMHLLHQEDQEMIWMHLNAHVKNAEKKIKKAAEDLKKELLQDIKEVKHN